MTDLEKTEEIAYAAVEIYRNNKFKTNAVSDLVDKFDIEPQEAWIYIASIDAYVDIVCL